LVLHPNDKPNIIAIDRTKPPERIWIYSLKEPVEFEESGIKLEALDISKIKLVHMLKPGERCIKGYEMMNRLKDLNYNLLDFGIFITLYHNQHLIPESWKQGGDRDLRVFFNGTITRCGNGRRHIFGLSYLICTSSGWCHTSRCLDEKYFGSDLSAVLSF